jgi:hypothetical protein
MEFKGRMVLLRAKHIWEKREKRWGLLNDLAVGVCTKKEPAREESRAGLSSIVC